MVGRLGVALFLIGGAACLEAPPSGGPGDGDGGGSLDDGGPAGPCQAQLTSSLVDDFVEEDALAGWKLASTDPDCFLCNHTDDVFVENTSANGECYMRSEAGYELNEVWVMIDVDQIGTGDPETEFRIWLSAVRYLAIKNLPGTFSLLDCAGVACNLIGNSIPQADQQFWRFRYDPTGLRVLADISTDRTDWVAFDPVVGLDPEAVACVFIEAGSYANPDGDNENVAFEGINVVE